MSQTIKEAIQVLKEYSIEHIYSIDQIKYWLEQHDDLYEYAKLNWNKGSCFGELPCSHTLNNELSKFIDFYNALQRIVVFHEYESYFWLELEEYQLIKDNPLKLKDWVKRNERLGSEEFVCFFSSYLDYLDYSEPETPYHLKVFISNFNEFDVYVDRKCFVNTIAFLEIFNKLFWEDEILPESIETIEEELKNFKTIDDDFSGSK